MRLVLAIAAVLVPGTAWTPALPGQGAFAPERVLTALQAGSYERWISFEWEKRWHPAIPDPEVALPHFARWVAATLR